MNRVQGELTAKQEKALVSLLSTGSPRETAKELELNETTLFRWLRTPEFQSRYREARRQVVETAIGELQAGCGSAVRVLKAVAEDTTAAPTARVMAARTILEQSFKAIELIDLQERLETLEQHAEGQGKKR